MKIVFAGGGTGGHFYPIIAVAEAVHDVVVEKHLLEPDLYFIAPKPFDEQALFANNIQFIKSPAGKVRRYASAKNVTGIFATLTGTIWTLIRLFRIYPDVVFSKGGYASVPTILAAHFLGIPIVIHESDAKPGRANLLAAKYAMRIAVAFDSVTQYLPVSARPKVARVGIPIRKAVASTITSEDFANATTEFQLDPTVPTVLVIGGSLGSQRINEMLLGTLGELVSSMNIIHQTGKDNFKEAAAEASILLEKNPHKDRYHVYGYLSADSLRAAASACALVVSRAGATSIAEISLWKRPAILIPIPETISHDQRTNAYAFAHTGGAIVLEEENMTPHILGSEIRHVVEDTVLAATMAEKGSTFGNPNAARIIAEELISIGLSHDAKNQ